MQMVGIEQPAVGKPLIWGFVAGLVALQITAFAALGLANPWEEVVLILLGVGALLGASAFYTRVRPDERLARLMRAIPELFLLSWLCGGLSYAGVQLGMPLWDETLMAWDRALGFDWAAWLRFVDARPWLTRALALAYETMLPQAGLVLVALATARRFRALDTFILAYGIAAAVTVTVAALMPAVSPLPFLDLDPADYPNSGLAMPIEVARLVLDMREGRTNLVALSSAQGLVTFPSFHTVGALLLGLAWAHVPWLRWPGVALNLVMLASVPSVGSHYLVDLLAGLAVGTGAWFFARALIERAARPRRAPALARAPVAA